MRANRTGVGVCITRRRAALALLGLALAGCGGGGGSSSVDTAAASGGSRQGLAITSRVNGTSYPLRVYLPPASAGARSTLPVVYVLDGESWFDVFAGIVESAGIPVIIVAINSAGQRNRDYVPNNLCTAGGGGQAAYFDFLRQELAPFIEATVGGDPRQRVLFGHSHGGSLVLYALFAEAPAAHSFKAYLPVDASVSCMSSEAIGWLADYAAAHADLPVRLYLSDATQGNHSANVVYAATIAQRGFAGLAFSAQSYSGTHGGIVPQALSDGLAFALAHGS
jgi:predicted alpha/beta superfamily hydrolase